MGGEGEWGEEGVKFLSIFMKSEWWKNCLECFWFFFSISSQKLTNNEDLSRSPSYKRWCLDDLLTSFGKSPENSRQSSERQKLLYFSSLAFTFYQQEGSPVPSINPSIIRNSNTTANEQNLTP